MKGMRIDPWSFLVYNLLTFYREKEMKGMRIDPWSFLVYNLLTFYREKEMKGMRIDHSIEFHIM
jgi:preprotein translocase subunit Sec61beta